MQPTKTNQPEHNKPSYTIVINDQTYLFDEHIDSNYLKSCLEFDGYNIQPLQLSHEFLKVTELDIKSTFELMNLKVQLDGNNETDDIILKSLKFSLGQVPKGPLAQSAVEQTNIVSVQYMLEFFASSKAPKILNNYCHAEVQKNKLFLNRIEKVIYNISIEKDPELKPLQVFLDNSDVDTLLSYGFEASSVFAYAGTHKLFDLSDYQKIIKYKQLHESKNDDLQVINIENRIAPPYMKRYDRMIYVPSALIEGQSILLAVHDWKTRLNSFTCAIFENFDWSNVAICGGCPSLIIKKFDFDKYPEADIDLFLWGKTADERLTKSQYILDFFRHKYGNNDVAAFQRKNVVSIFIRNIERCIQLVDSGLESLASVLNDFDFGVCKVSYNGDKFLASGDYILSLIHQCSSFLTDKTKICRAYKYIMRGYSLLCQSNSVFIMDVKNETTDNIDWKNLRKEQTVLHTMNKYLTFNSQTLERLLFQVQSFYAFDYELVINEITPYDFMSTWKEGYNLLINNDDDQSSESDQSLESHEYNITNSLIPSRENLVSLNENISDIDISYKNYAHPVRFTRAHLTNKTNIICFELRNIEIISLGKDSNKNIDSVFIKIDAETKNKIKANCKLFKELFKRDPKYTNHKINIPIRKQRDNITGQKLRELNTLFIKVKNCSGYKIYLDNKKLSLSDLDRYIGDSDIKANLIIVPYIYFSQQAHYVARGITFKLVSMRIYLA
jgi:hypothetical protein